MASIPKSKPERKPKPADLKETFSLVSHEKLLAIYKAMIRCRMVQQRATMLFQQGKLASDLHASAGREASAAAIAIDLQPSDSLSLVAGDWLPAMIKGMAPESIFRVLTPSSAESNEPAILSAGEAEQKNILLGENQAVRPRLVRDRALAVQAAKLNSIVCAILPSTEQWLKPWHDVLAVAASRRLPIVFVHYDNASDEPEKVPTSRKSKNPGALVHGVPAINVDALDAVAVYRVAYEAIVRARQGRGATLLECLTIPEIAVRGNSNGKGTSAAPVLPSDPVATMEAYLESKGIDPAQHNHQTVPAFNLELDLATRFLGP